jgi:hypothetical protein
VATVFSGNSSVGGLVGYNRGSVTDCHSTGAVSGSEAVGGTDLTNDGFVDFEDLMELADNWLAQIAP